jgi:hypothetical protein
VKLYYKSKLQELVDERMAEEAREGETASEKKARRLVTTTEISTRCWESETDEVKKAVEANYQAEMLERAETRQREGEPDEAAEAIEGADRLSPQELQKYVATCIRTYRCSLTSRPQEHRWS